MERLRLAIITKHFLIVFIGLGVLFFIACSGGVGSAPTDTSTTGTIHISVDESFKPVIDSHIKVLRKLNWVVSSRLPIQLTPISPTASVLFDI